MTAPYRIEGLGADHDRSGFTCGNDALDRYFRHHASQDVRRRVSACYVAVAGSSAHVAGYYTLSAGSVPLGEMSGELICRLPRYPCVPVARLGRLAVDLRYRAQKLGGALLWDAIARAARSEVAVFAMVVEAKDAQAASFYRHHGFVAFEGVPARLILPLARRA